MVQQGHKYVAPLQCGWKIQFVVSIPDDSASLKNLPTIFVVLIPWYKYMDYIDV
jgi:hypothetical protein